MVSSQFPLVIPTIVPTQSRDMAHCRPRFHLLNPHGIDYVGGMTDTDERSYMVAGEDESGDQHLFITESRDRAISQFHEMTARLRNVRGNEAFELYARPQT